jgi:hypothetical protein
MQQTVSATIVKPGYWAQLQASHARNRASFTFDLCDCFSDCGTLCYAHMCFPCLMSENSARLDNNDNTCGCCYPASAAKNRLQAKAQFGVQPNCDCLISWLFPCCSEMQIKRELDFHRNGQANQQVVHIGQPVYQQQQVQMAPTQQTMY